MPELWVPKTNGEIDVTNMFDMMMVFQEQIDSEPTEAGKFKLAKHSVGLMCRLVEGLDDDAKFISLTTDLAMVDRSHDSERQIQEGIGLRGILDDVSGLKIDGSLPLTMSLGINVLDAFPMGEPDDFMRIPNSAITPITMVHYIETHAA